MAVLLIPNALKDQGLTVTRRAAELLQQRNVRFPVPDAVRLIMGENRLFVFSAQLFEQLQQILSVHIFPSC